MARCLDTQLIVDHVLEENSDSSSDLEALGRLEIKKISKMAGFSDSERDLILEQFSVFKTRVNQILIDDSKDGIREKFGHHIFETHDCTKDCEQVGGKCPNLEKVLVPLKVKNMKMLHLFLKEESLYSGIEMFMSLYLQSACKTHAEGVAESMGSYVDIHSDKRRGLDVAIVGMESYIHWNGPPIHLADSIGVGSLDSYFAGRTHWRFVTRKNKLESAVVSRLKRQKAKKHCLISWC